MCDGPPMRLWSKKNSQMIIFTSPEMAALDQDELLHDSRHASLDVQGLHRAVRALRAAGQAKLAASVTMFWRLGFTLSVVWPANACCPRKIWSTLLRMVLPGRSIRSNVLECSSLYNTCYQILHHFPIYEQGVRTDTKLASPFVVEE